MSHARKQKREGESGQVLIEFILVFSFVLTLIFLFVQMSWGIAWGHYVHYSTFMASRAYLSAGVTKSDQADAAGEVLAQTLKAGGKDLFPFIAPSRAGGDRDTTGPEPVPGAMVGMHPMAIGKEHSRLYSWAEGVQYNFNIKIFLIPIAKVMTAGDGNAISAGDGTKSIQWKGMIPMTSDSFLGREPSVDECTNEMVRLSTETGISRGDGNLFLEDNGC